MRSIKLFEGLGNQGNKPEHRQGRAGAYNWLGLTLSGVPGRAADAEQAYDSALALQDDLMRANSSRDEYQQDAARTRYNRGILRFNSASSGSGEFGAAESDFREAIRLLEPLAGRPSDPVPALELARAYNNLGNVLAQDDSRLVEARGLYEAAIRRDEELMAAEPANRVYKMELAMLCNNLSYLLEQLGDNDLAKARSLQALDLLDELALPAPSLSIEQADAHNLRGQLMQAQDPRGALAEYRQALEIYQSRWRDHTAHNVARVHERYQDFLLNLARFGRNSRAPEVHALLLGAIHGYLDQGQASLESGSVANTRLVLENVSNLLPELAERDRAAIMKPLRTLQESMAARK
jgi:tetratricopeptide (TPR) repeat protein